MAKTRDEHLRMLGDYEAGALSDAEVLELFAGLIASGDAWTLQGYYGRAAARFIEDKLISEDGRINWFVVNQFAGGALHRE